MNHRLKQRLIGAAILVALGVIFLPMLLDGTGWRQRHSDVLEIPPEPEFVLPERPGSVRRPVSIPEPRPQAEGSAPAPAAAGSPAAQPPTPEAPPAPTAPSPSPPVKQQSAKPEPPPERAAPRAHKADSETAAAAKEPTTVPTKGWSVQVGAFEKRTGAEKLAARLRQRGYPVYIRRTDVGSKSLYRVKVGPVKSRAEAMKLRKRLERSERISGLVQRER